MMHDLIKSQGF